MLESGVLERSNSNFLNSLAVVKKKIVDIRLSLDMLNHNSLFVKELDVLPLQKNCALNAYGLDT